MRFKSWDKVNKKWRDDIVIDGLGNYYELDGGEIYGINEDIEIIPIDMRPPCCNDMNLQRNMRDGGWYCTNCDDAFMTYLDGDFSSDTNKK